LMVKMNKLLEVRKKIKGKKPEFIQQDYHKKRRLSKKWKRPTGLQSKMRHQFKGYNRRVKQGWRSPVEIRGYHGKGLKVLLVRTLKDIESADKDLGLIIQSSVGLRKKLILLEAAEKKGLTVLNLRIDNVKKKHELLKQSKQESKKDRDAKKKKTIEDSSKKAEKKKPGLEDKTEEEKKAEEKKAKDEVLIHKE